MIFDVKSASLDELREIRIRVDQEIRLREARTAAVEKWRKKQFVKGLCRSCKKPAVKARFCEKHYAAHQERNASRDYCSDCNSQKHATGADKCPRGRR